jgi:hypothetical protein
VGQRVAEEGEMSNCGNRHTMQAAQQKTTHQLSRRVDFSYDSSALKRRDSVAHAMKKAHIMTAAMAGTAFMRTHKSMNTPLLFLEATVIVTIRLIITPRNAAMTTTLGHMRARCVTGTRRVGIL